MRSERLRFRRLAPRQVRRIARRIAGGLLAAVIVGVVAISGDARPLRAQEPPTLQPPRPGPNADTAPALPDTGETLGERLDRSDGVIRPPEGVAPDMRVPPKNPEAGSTMPVIPPPGTPGGDRSVQPK